MSKGAARLKKNAGLIKDIFYKDVSTADKKNRWECAGCKSELSANSLARLRAHLMNGGEVKFCAAVRSNEMFELSSGETILGNVVKDYALQFHEAARTSKRRRIADRGDQQVARQAMLSPVDNVDDALPIANFRESDRDTPARQSTTQQQLSLNRISPAIELLDEEADVTSLATVSHEQVGTMNVTSINRKFTNDDCDTRLCRLMVCHGLSSSLQNKMHLTKTSVTAVAHQQQYHLVTSAVSSTPRVLIAFEHGSRAALRPRPFLGRVERFCELY